jgi:hypothetical protein
LNQEVAAKIENGESVTAPGVPKNYLDVKKLVTEDCIKQYLPHPGLLPTEQENRPPSP